MFYVIEINRTGGDTLAAWIEWERYEYLPTATNRATVMLEDEPKLKGRIRVCASRPLDAINARFV